MDYYLLFFGLGVIILVFAGIFYTLREFNAMADQPDDYSKSQDKLNLS